MVLPPTLLQIDSDLCSFSGDLLREFILSARYIQYGVSTVKNVDGSSGLYLGLDTFGTGTNGSDTPSFRGFILPGPPRNKTLAP